MRLISARQKNTDALSDVLRQVAEIRRRDQLLKARWRARDFIALAI
jgi:hypothetical protein